MGRAATVEAWLRRKEFSLTLLGVGGSAAVIAQALGQSVVAIVSLVVAVAGIVVPVVIAFGLRGAEARREGAVLEGQLLAPISPIDQINPIEIGVDAAAKEEMGLDSEVPDYMPRDVDAEVQEALAQALDGSGQWIVVVCGLSKVGKSRTLFEGLRRCGAGRKLRLVAPVNGAALEAQLEQVKTRRWSRTRYVLWLDDLESFAADGVGPQTLNAWRRKGAIVAATYGGRGSERDFGADSDLVNSLSERIAPGARLIGLKATSERELQRLPASLSKLNRKTVAEFGLAATLVAAPMLVLKLYSQQHRAGEPRSPVGAAIAFAAINWARCGRSDSLTGQQLRDLCPGYIEGEPLVTEEAFEEGLKWARRPVTGHISLLRGSDPFQAYDYARRIAENHSDSPAISEETWRLARDTDDPGQALSVGVAAYDAGRTQDAERTLTLASSHDESETAAVASVNLGTVLQELGRNDEAEAAFRRGARLGASNEMGFGQPSSAEIMAEYERPDENMRHAIEEQLSSEGFLGDGATITWTEDVFREEMEAGDGESAYELAMTMMSRDELAEAVAMFRKAIKLGFTPAAANLGIALKQMGDVRGAKAAYREGMEQDLPEAAFNLALLLYDEGKLKRAEKALRRAVELGHGAAASNLGVLLQQRGDLKGAEASFRLAMERDEPAGAVNLSTLLENAGRIDEAEACLWRFAAQGSLDAAIPLARLLLERGKKEQARDAFRAAAAANETDDACLFAVLLEETGDLEGAEEAYRESIERKVGLAAHRLGVLLMAQGREDEAKEAFETARRLEEEERRREEQEDEE